MKTYKTTIEKPRLVIEYDEYCDSPREWSNLGYFITVDRNYESPDKFSDLQNIVKETGNEAGSQEEHIEMIKKQFTEEKIIAIYPVVKYEHSGVVYRLGTAHGFDYSNNGFYIITDRTQKALCIEEKDFERVINDELERYNQWCNGEVYRFCLFDEQGEVEDSCCGFYSIEDIREHLPKEWHEEDLSEYIK
jgi:hypothetical protein